MKRVLLLVVLTPFLIALTIALTSKSKSEPSPVSVMRSLPPPIPDDDLHRVVAPDHIQPWPVWISGPFQMKAVLDVNPDGSVARVQRLLTWPSYEFSDAVEASMRKWQFLGGSSRRRVVLVELDQKPSPGATHVEARQLASVAYRPHVVRYTLHYDDVYRQPRVNDLPEERWCPLHRQQMFLREVPLTHGLPPPPSAARRAYLHAAETQFPNGAVYVDGGCNNPMRGAEVYVCDACRDAREAWLAAHGGQEPPE